MNIIRLIPVGILISQLGIVPANASPRIALLNFELNDITSLPDTPAERQRTATMAPLLQEALGGNGDAAVVIVDNDLQKSANTSFGYLFRFHDIAARLGEQLNADWMIVSQHSKPSFLYSYLWVYLIDVKAQRAIARYDIELKGNHESVTRRAIHSLARQIRQTIASNESRSRASR